MRHLDWPTTRPPLRTSAAARAALQATEMAEDPAAPKREASLPAAARRAYPTRGKHPNPEPTRARPGHADDPPSRLRTPLPLAMQTPREVDAWDADRSWARRSRVRGRKAQGPRQPPTTRTGSAGVPRLPARARGVSSWAAGAQGRLPAARSTNPKRWTLRPRRRDHDAPRFRGSRPPTRATTTPRRALDKSVSFSLPTAFRRIHALQVSFGPGKGERAAFRISRDRPGVPMEASAGGAFDLTTSAAT